MREQQLVIFCSGFETDLEKVCCFVEDWLEGAGLGEFDVWEVRAPDVLAGAGWGALAVAGGEVRLAALEERLEALVHAGATRLNEDLLGVFIDSARGHARVCLGSPGCSPRSSQGEVLRILRETATWLEADPAHLLRYFGASEDPPRTDQEAPLGDAPPVVGEEVDEGDEAEQDEDDLFVETKLKQARELMERYLRRRK